MSATAGHADLAETSHAQTSNATRLGFKSGQVVQEIGYDEDCDEALRADIEALIGAELVDENYDDVADIVLLWHRADDGDLIDALVDTLTALADGGHIWLLTPKTGRPGHIEPSDIGEAAPIAGLSSTSSISAGSDWIGTRLVTPRARAAGKH